MQVPIRMEEGCVQRQPFRIRAISEAAETSPGFLGPEDRGCTRVGNNCLPHGLQRSQALPYRQRPFSALLFFSVKEAYLLKATAKGSPVSRVLASIEDASMNDRAGFRSPQTAASGWVIRGWDIQ